MLSLVWERDPREAYRNPYEYAAQEQFVREASKLLKSYYPLLNPKERRFTRDERSVEKAVWLLQMDALDSLRDCLSALERRNHRVAGKLFRSVIEPLDLAAYFHGRTTKTQQDLQRWYEDKWIRHSDYRDYLKNTVGKEAAEESRRHYRGLSGLVHRSYSAVLDGYTVGGGDRLVHDGTGLLYSEGKHSETALIPPQTIAAYYATLANLILIFSDEIVRRGLVKHSELKTALNESLEVETVPRRFMPREWLRPPKSQPKEPSETDEDNSS